AVCVAVAAADRLENTYLPPSSAKTAGGSPFLNAPRQGGGGGGAGRGAFGGSSNAQIGIVRFDNVNNGDGSYKFDYETENRITHQESGQLKNPGTDQEINSVQGAFSYTGDDGASYSISYTADENGFQPQGAHLPVAPPIPEEILKSLEQNAADEAAGIIDDGSYRAEHQGGAGGAGGRGSGGYSGAGVANQYIAPRPSSGGQQGYRY
ncbi:pupal cuticle protein 36-like, partial [Asbolus verrucosus]